MALELIVKEPARFFCVHGSPKIASGSRRHPGAPATPRRRDPASSETEVRAAWPWVGEWPLPFSLPPCLAGLWGQDRCGPWGCGGAYAMQGVPRLMWGRRIDPANLFSINRA